MDLPSKGFAKDFTLVPASLYLLVPFAQRKTHLTDSSFSHWAYTGRLREDGNSTDELWGFRVKERTKKKKKENTHTKMSRG